jgi:hypothetical protein
LFLFRPIQGWDTETAGGVFAESKEEAVQFYNAYNHIKGDGGEGEVYKIVEHPIHKGLYIQPSGHDAVDINVYYCKPDD